LPTGLIPKIVVDPGALSSRGDQAPRQLAHLADERRHLTGGLATPEAVGLRHDALDGAVDVAAGPDGQQRARQDDAEPHAEHRPERPRRGGVDGGDRCREAGGPAESRRPAEGDVPGVTVLAALAEDAGRVAPRTGRETRGHRLLEALRGA